MANLEFRGLFGPPPPHTHTHMSSRWRCSGLRLRKGMQTSLEKLGFLYFSGSIILLVTYIYEQSRPLWISSGAVV